MAPKRKLRKNNKDYCKRYREKNPKKYRKNYSERKRYQRIVKKANSNEELKRKNRARMRLSCALNQPNSVQPE